ncbi:MAG: hypothetical protein GEU98_07030 [Pseudonocardiaceae bacterium]|nr:hypothetical protein [Pseudonocardiaceae bacterium]
MSAPQRPGGPHYPPHGQPGYGQPGYGLQARQLDLPEFQKPPRPASVHIAFGLLLLAAALGLAAGIIGFIAANDAAERAGAGSSILRAYAVFALVLVAMLIASVFAMWSGHNWARILLTVLGLLSVLSAVVDIVGLADAFEAGGSEASRAVLALGRSIAMVVGFVFMYVGGANHYFRTAH